MTLRKPRGRADAHGSGLPNAAQRLARDRFAVGVVVSISLMAAMVGTVRDQAAIELTRAVDANWRGSYDILVRAPGMRLGLEQTAGLVEPNFLQFAGRGGLSADELAAIRATPGVELAAPVAVIGSMQYVAAAPDIFISRDALPEQPTLYEVVVTAESSDGLAAVPVQRQEFRILLGPAADLDAGRYVYESGSMSWDDDGVLLTLETLPPLATTVIAVDPAAERKLLGPSADFLDPLGTVAVLDEAPEVGSFDPALIASDYTDQAQSLQLLALDPRTAQRPVIPLAVSDSLYAPLHLSLAVTRVGSPLDEYPDSAAAAQALEQAALLAGEERHGLGEDDLDATERLRPFGVPSLTLVWPGAAAPELASRALQRAPELAPRVAGRPTYSAIAPRDDRGALSFAIAPVGLAAVDGRAGNEAPVASARAPGVTRGMEQTYRSLSDAELPLLDDFMPAWDLDVPFALAPVASFDLAALQLPDNPLNYVPLGAYEPPRTELVEEADGSSRRPGAMNPTLNPAGLLTAPPLAITDLRSAELLRGDRPIDAVRIRVAGVEQFDAGGMARIENVAAALDEMGFEVDIVAGSSPQLVEIHVPDYVVLDGQQTADLGWVNQPWTTIGAAARVTTGLGSTNTSLLTLAAATAITLAGALQAMKVAMRRREAAILIALGWTPGHIVRWLSADGLLSGCLILVAGIAVWAITGGAASALPIIALLAAITPVAAVVAAVAAKRSAAAAGASARGDATTLSVGAVRSPATYGVRTAVSRPLRTLIVAIACAIGAVAACAGLLLVASASAIAGPTLLGDMVAGRIAPHQLLLLAITAVSALALVVMLLRLDARHRRAEFAVLRASGWTPGHVRTGLVTQRAAIAVPASAAAVLMAVAFAGLALPIPLVAAGSVAVVVLALGAEAALTSVRPEVGS